MIILYYGRYGQKFLGNIVEMFDTVAEFKQYIENYLLSFAETSIVDEKGNKLPFEKLLEKYSELNADVHITTNIE